MGKQWKQWETLFWGAPKSLSEKAMAPHSSTLAWKIPWMEEPGGYSPWDREESNATERVHFDFSLWCIGEGNGNPLQCSCLQNPRTEEPGRLPSLGSHRVGHDWNDLAAAAAAKITVDGDYSHEIKRCLLLGWKAVTNLDSILKSRDITLQTNVHLVKAIVFPVVMYGCEIWTIKKVECQRIDALELWCCRRLFWESLRLQGIQTSQS